MRHIPRRRRLFPALALALLLPAVACADDGAAGISDGIRADMAEARREVSAELAAARRELETGNLELGGSLRLGGTEQAREEAAALPKAEITPAGDFLVEGKAATIDAGQRRALLAYRTEVIDIARAGLELGERSAGVALDAVDQGLFRLMFSAMTGSLERRMEKSIRQTIEPGVREICARLPALLETQQRLADAVPGFRPYATLRADDVDDCMAEVSRGFARR